MAQPIRMQTIPVMTSVKRSVKPCGENQAAGSTVPIQPDIYAAVEVTLKDSLKPNPVRGTTPMTMPAVAAAAPTDRKSTHMNSRNEREPRMTHHARTHKTQHR